MKIALSTSVIQRGKTGIAQYLLSLVRAFLPYVDEHEFTLYVLEEDLPLFAFADKSMKLVPVREKFRPAVRNLLWHQTALPGLLRRERVDLLHVPSYRRLLWPRPCVLVATICDLAPFRVPGKYDLLRMFFGRVIARQLAHRQDEIIAISQNTAQDIHTYFRIPKERITVTHLGLDHQRFFPDSVTEAKAAAEKRYGLRGPFFLYLARLEHPGKNHVRLIDAFNRFKAETRSDWRLALGGADWSGAEAIHAAAQRSPYVGEIYRLGFVSQVDLPMLYRAADAFVFPSLYEGFGLPPLEAMACGCPVISSTRGSLGEVVNGAAAIVDPEEVESLQGQLKAFAQDAAVRERWRAAGLHQARKFDWDKTAAGTLQVYARAMASKKNKLANRPTSA